MMGESEEEKEREERKNTFNLKKKKGKGRNQAREVHAAEMRPSWAREVKTASKIGSGSRFPV